MKLLNIFAVCNFLSLWLFLCLKIENSIFHQIHLFLETLYFQIFLKNYLIKINFFIFKIKKFFKLIFQNLWKLLLYFLWEFFIKFIKYFVILNFFMINKFFTATLLKFFHHLLSTCNDNYIDGCIIIFAYFYECLFYFRTFFSRKSSSKLTYFY